MISFLRAHAGYIVMTLVAVAVAAYIVLSLSGDEPTMRVTATVERGAVEQLVSVSGIVEAEQTAHLSFPTSGIVEEVYVTEGDPVTAGTVLVTLQARSLAADRAEAVAARTRAVATRDELLAGASATTRTTNAESLQLREATLDTIRATQADIVQNAYQAVLSSHLEAVSTDTDEAATPPTIGGAYTCTTEGSYTLDVYASSAESGYSFRLSGLESGTYTASTDQAVSFGTCGLTVQFAPNNNYRNTTWIIDIPNTRADNYVTNRNTYTLAQTQASSAITIAEQDVALAQAQTSASNAPARSEAIARANADITAATARIARVDAQLADRVMRAPFTGTITSIDILPGETVTTTPMVTLLAADTFKLTARVPEIDIGTLIVGQSVRAVFDARDTEILSGTITFISLAATEIDGVSYYEATIVLDESPAWLRSGLNADVDIIIDRVTDTLRLPTRFVDRTTDTATVLRETTPDTTATTTVSVTLVGDDGYIGITGLSEGDVVVAP